LSSGRDPSTFPSRRSTNFAAADSSNQIASTKFVINKHRHVNSIIDFGAAHPSTRSTSAIAYIIKIFFASPSRIIHSPKSMDHGTSQEN
jgi:hypothetical protein